MLADLARVLDSVPVSPKPEVYAAALDRAVVHARSWLASLSDRAVPPRLGADELRKGLGGPLPDGPSEPADVVDLLAELVEPGLTAMPSGRFFGWVTGGTLPAALAADWLVSAWMSGSRWRDRDVLRISVSNWSTDEEDVAASVDAVCRAATQP